MAPRCSMARRASMRCRRNVRFSARAHSTCSLHTSSCAPARNPVGTATATGAPVCAYVTQARLPVAGSVRASARARPLRLLLAHLQLRCGPFGAAKAIAGWRARARVCPWLAARARSRRQVPAGLQHALLQAQARGWTRTCAGANTSCAAYMCHAQVCNAASCLLLGLGQLNSMAAGAPRRSASSPAAYWCASRSVLSSMKSVGTLTEARRAEQSAVGSQRP